MWFSFISRSTRARRRVVATALVLWALCAFGVAGTPAVAVTGVGGDGTFTAVRTESRWAISKENEEANNAEEQETPDSPAGAEYGRAAAGASCNDFAKLFTNEQIAAWTKRLQQLRQETALDVVVVTVGKIDTKPVYFAQDFYRYGGYGVGAGRDGILMLIAVDSRDLWFSTYGAGRERFPDEIIPLFYSTVKEPLSQDNWTGGVDAFLDTVAAAWAAGPDSYYESAYGTPLTDANKAAASEWTKKIGGSRAPNIQEFWKVLAGSALAALALAGGIVYMWWRRHNTLRTQSGAGSYITVPLNLDISHDEHVDTKVTRIYSPQEKSRSSSGGGGGFSSGGSGGFGGGGGKF